MNIKPGDVITVGNQVGRASQRQKVEGRRQKDFYLLFILSLRITPLLLIYFCFLLFAFCLPEGRSMERFL